MDRKFQIVVVRVVSLHIVEVFTLKLQFVEVMLFKMCVDETPLDSA